MAQRKPDQSGIAHVMLLIVIILLVVVGFAGWRVMQASKEKEDTTETPTAQKTAEKTVEKPEEWTEGGMAVAGTYADADVLKISEGKWRMYYAIQPEVQGGNLAVYSATSTDGITWTQESGTRKTMATFPDVVSLADGTYRMYFQGSGVLKSAISSDGLNFTDEAGTRVDTANSEDLTFDNVAAPSVMQMADGTYVMVYRGTINTRYAQNTPNPSTQVLMWATSEDGLTFTKKGLAVDSRNETLNGQLDGPDLVTLEDDTYRLYATTYTGVYQFSFDGTTFGEASLAYAGEAKKTAQGFTGSPPGDPSTVQIGDTWFMYYGGPRDKNGINYATLQ